MSIKYKTTSLGTEVILKALRMLEVYSHLEDWVSEEELELCKKMRREIQSINYDRREEGE
jgi:hypothetical protein|tara:strand:- start:2062 stop:2241 length:180 start_codon:yes stop_codon:yes gene_type:complete